MSKYELEVDTSFYKMCPSAGSIDKQLSTERCFFFRLKRKGVLQDTVKNKASA